MMNVTRLTARIEREAREDRAAQLVVAGATVRDVATQLDVSKSTAHRLIDAGLERVRTEETRDLQDARTLELARLDRLQAAVWDRAIQGHIPSVNVVLRISDRRRKLLGLDADPQGAPTTNAAMEREIEEWMDQLIAAREAAS